MCCFCLHVFLVYSLLHCQTIVQILHHFAVTVNNIEVTINTSTCKDVFTPNYSVTAKF